MTRFKAVVFDWAGTVIDFGSFAPMGVFVKAFAQFGVEVRQRFIHHEQPRAPDDGSSDGDALHLASRETLGRPIQQSLDVQQPRRPLHLLSDVVYIRAELGSGAP